MEPRLEFWLPNVENGLPNVSGQSPNEWLQLRLFTQFGNPSFETGGANFTRVCCFSVLLIRVLTTKRQEWTTKRHWTTSKEIVMIIIGISILGGGGNFTELKNVNT